MPPAPPASSTPVDPVPAASLILLRQAETGVQVLTGRRYASTRAFPQATVFPGGKLEPQDAALAEALGDAHPQAPAALAALRETFEETGLLVCEGGLGTPAGADVASARQAVEAGELSFSALLERWGRRVDPARLTPFAHWVTPAAAPYRFDTRFFLAEASAEEASSPLICSEFERLAWAEPTALLSDPASKLMTPTRHALKVLCEVAGVAAILEAARRREPFDYPRGGEGRV